MVGILKKDDEILGTGCYKDNHITRVYVKPTFQKQGYGSYIMQCLENEIRLRYDKVYLDASLPASHLYEKRGYKTIKHKRWNVGNGVILVYEIMEKSLEKCSTHICYNERCFVPRENTENGELDFYYQHINEQNQVRVGVCHSVPKVLENGKIELSEKWQWLNGDKSEGSSLLVEV